MKSKGKPVSVRSLQDILLLVDEYVTLRVLRTWTPRQRRAALVWAGKTHLRASDNPVRVPPKPRCLRGAKRTPRRWGGMG